MENTTEAKRWVWAKPALAVAISAISTLYLPTILPVLSVPHFLAYEHKTGIEQQKFEHMPQGVLPQLYADMFGWEPMVQRVAAFYRTLSPEQQRNTAIFANNYGEAGAIDFFGPRYGLPKAISGHQTYWIWGTHGFTGKDLIVLGDHDERNMQNDCASYRVIGSTEDPLSRRDEWAPIYYCQGIKWNLQTIWPDLKRWR